MKRFLTLITAFMLAFSLAIPSFAVDYPLPDGIPDPSGKIKSDWPYAVIVEGTNGMYHLVMSAEPFYLDGSVVRCTVTKDITIYNSFASKNNGSFGTVSNSLGTPSLGWTKLYWANHELTSLICDGSACSAWDENFNGLCDECGFALMNLTRQPVYPVVDGSNKNYVAFYSGTVYKYTSYTSDSSYTIRGEEYGARYRTYTDPSVDVKRFESYDGINWQETYSGKTANDYPGEIGSDELIASTFDWYTEDGEHFFPVPLWKEIQEVTQGEMPALEAEADGTMRTLVLCGVGLMALLMVLSLFGKRWLLFLR